MKLKAKMLTGFFVIIALLVVLSVFAILQMNSVTDQNVYATEFPSKRELIMYDMQAKTRDLRRLVATMAAYATLDDASAIEPLHEDAIDVYESAMKALDEYDAFITTDPVLTKTEKSVRFEKSSEIRRALDGYMNDVCKPITDFARNGDYENAVHTITASSELITDLRTHVTALVAFATETAKKANTDAEETAQWASVLIIIITVIAAFLALTIALAMATVISKPLKPLAAFMKKAGATGDLTLNPEDIDCINTNSSHTDEIGEAICGAASFVSQVTHIANELEQISNCDLTSEIIPLSETDIMGKSLKRMVSSLNSIFGEIQLTTSHVSSGSKQVADGAQALAQGSTQQAASIQELSGFIAKIADKTVENARTADETSKLSATIKQNAEKGSRQMDEMIVAVKDINDASHSISKIIKTIDDIAFQTNILALNAAVEAARAGQHGKGFAVVAEEVRNLASKSAEAARDTGGMIQNSMEKAELGSRIAGETAVSLNEIVTGISESTHLIDEIARASEEQSQGISQINTSINEVAQVVQQNSATAEESAAASEEMTGQSSALQRLITQFKLREKETLPQSLSPQEASQWRKYELQGEDDYPLAS